MCKDFVSSVLTFLPKFTLCLMYRKIELIIILFAFMHRGGTYRDDRTSWLSHLRTFSSHFTFIISKKLLSPFFNFSFQPKVLQSFISSQLTTWFRHDSQKTSISPRSSWPALPPPYQILHSSTNHHPSDVSLEHILLEIPQQSRLSFWIQIHNLVWGHLTQSPSQ